MTNFSEDDGTRTRNHRIDMHAPKTFFSKQKTLPESSLVVQMCFRKE